MGICQAGGKHLTEAQKAQLQKAKEITRQIDMATQDQMQEDEKIKKLLLLGAGESGKSTLFKQMITLYGKGYSEQERKAFRNVMAGNTVLCAKTIVEETDLLKEEAGIDGCEISPEHAASKDFINNMKVEDVIDETVVGHIKALLTDAGFMKTYENRAKYQLLDSAMYFFGRLDDMKDPDFVPTEQDVLRSRVKTTGIVETSFSLQGSEFQMFDVGGQRNERKKWIHCFENVTAVLFVAAISAYDQVLYEDESVNRMHESLELFAQICNSKWFTETSMILFLNKKDLFEEKIKNVPLTVAFPDYDGPGTMEHAQEYIQNQFEAKNLSDEKEVYPHVTNATDKDNISHVFEAVKDTIVRQSLKDGGLLD